MALTMAMNSTGLPMQILKPTGLPLGQLPELGDEAHHLDRGREGLVVGGREHVLARRHEAGLGDLLGDLGAGQDAAVAGLGALGHLDLDHLDLVVGGVRAEQLRIEVAVRGAAAEVAGADLPDQVAAVLEVVLGQAALAGVVGEAAQLGAGVHGRDRRPAERAEAHGRDVEHRDRVRLRALRAAHGHPQAPPPGPRASGAAPPSASSTCSPRRRRRARCRRASCRPRSWPAGT